MGGGLAERQRRPGPGVGEPVTWGCHSDNTEPVVL